MDVTTPTKLAEEAGISVPYASQILSGKRVPPLAMALTIFFKTGRRFGPIKTASAVEIDTLAKFQPEDKAA